MKELFLITITKPPKVIVISFFLSHLKMLWARPPGFSLGQLSRQVSIMVGQLTSSSTSYMSSLAASTAELMRGWTLTQARICGKRGWDECVWI